MASLPTRSFERIVQSIAAGIQGRAADLIDFAVGSPLRAIAESFSGVGLWLEALALRILAVARLATSSGVDVDTFVADFGLTRLGAQTALGQVTFSRYTAGAQALIPVNAVVQTSDGSQRFFVVADASNGSYNAGLGGYVVPAGVSSASVPVAAVSAGTGGNVAAGSIALVGTVIPYIDTVTNATAFAGGGDAESDAALKMRFVWFIAALAKATVSAVRYAVLSLRLGLDVQVIEGQNYDGSWRPGFFCVIVDDGSGAPPPALLSAAYAAVDDTRAAGILFGLFPPVTTAVDVSMTLTVAQGYDAVAVRGAVGTAITNFLASARLGDGLPFTKLAQLAYEASPGVTNASGILANGATADLAGAQRVVLRPGVITVN